MVEQPKRTVNHVADCEARAERIQEEGARYNLGSMRSTLGNPVLALGVLQKTYQQRFQFTLGKENRNAGPGVFAAKRDST